MDGIQLPSAREYVCKTAGIPQEPLAPTKRKLIAPGEHKIVRRIETRKALFQQPVVRIERPSARGIIEAYRGRTYTTWATPRATSKPS